MVWLTICGKIVESRDQVLRTRFSPLRFMVSTRVSSFASTYGPFFNDRDMVESPLDYRLSRRRTISRSDAFLCLRVLTP